MGDWNERIKTLMSKIVCTGPIGEAAIEILSKYGTIEILCEADDLTATMRGAIGFVVRGGGRADAGLILGAKELRVIGRSGTGYDTIDLRAANERGIPVVFAPGQNARAVAEAAFSLIAALTKRLLFWDRRMKEGDWDSRLQYKPGDLTGKTLGIVGLGNSGKILAEFARSFRMHPLAYDPYASLDVARSCGVELVDFEDLCKRSDIVSLHLPLNSETRGLIDRKILGLFRPGTILVNMARGGLIESMDLLLEGLESGPLGGVGLDVFEPEPPNTEHPLFDHPDCLTSPHALALTEDAMDRIYRTMAEGMAAVFEGRRPEFVANPEVFREGRNGPPQSWPRRLKE
jgi:phosphoglycerate dehydrogenase-like enzyme